MAECHPVGFQWVMEAKLRGAKIIHIDPRFTRTSAVADTHVPIRAGSDIVFLGAVINYILSEEKYFREYVVAYTNAATLIDPEYIDANDLDGVFSGYDPETGTYDTSSWAYEGESEHAAGGGGSSPGGHDDNGSGHGAEGEESESERGAGHELGGHGAPLSHHHVSSVTRPCSTHGACSRSCGATTPVTPPSWCRRPVGSVPSSCARCAKP